MLADIRDSKPPQNSLGDSIKAWGAHVNASGTYIFEYSIYKRIINHSLAG